MVLAYDTKGAPEAGDAGKEQIDQDEIRKHLENQLQSSDPEGKGADEPGEVDETGVDEESLKLVISQVRE